VSRSNGSLRVIKPDAAPVEVPIAVLKAIFLYPGVAITDPAERLILAWGIIILRLNQSGYLKGVSISPQHFPDYALLKKQIELEQNEEWRTELGKTIARSKLKSQSAYLRYRHKTSIKKGQRFDYLLEGAEKIEQLEAKLRNSSNLWRIRGIEGKASRIYFDSLGRFLREKGFNFYGRKYRPNPDLVNATLSYGYAVLRGYVYIATVAAKLMPYPGILHEDHTHNKMALVYDLMEEFRVAVVDSIVLKLLLNKQLNLKHVKREGQAVLLNSLGREVLIKAIVNRTLEEFRHPKTGERAELKEIIVKQALRLASAIKHEKTYRPFYLLP